MKALLFWRLVSVIMPVVAAGITVGNVRIEALSPTLLRVEPIGPRGFMDRTSFMVTDRDAFQHIPISLLNNTQDGAWLGTKDYLVFIKQRILNNGTCASTADMDVDYPQRSPQYKNGAHAKDEDVCCSLCAADTMCTTWIFDKHALVGTNCWPLFSWAKHKPAKGRVMGGVGTASPITALRVHALDGTVLYSQEGTGPDPEANLLQWPAPVSSTAYALVDYPRFYVPEWGATPVPPGTHVDPALVPTSGFDFRDNQLGDTYIFLLGSTTSTWHASRKEFLTLTGNTPLIPDYAFGTWFTYWHPYTEAEAKQDIARWHTDDLPLSVWGLDMNWRNTSDNQDHFYDHPATNLFPDFVEWFRFIHDNGLKTFFNDHPFPVDMQTAPKEVDFRYSGLTKWLENGLDFWWFDRNWKFSIPAPNMFPVGGWNISFTEGMWQGLSNAAWGSHLYYSSVSRYDREHRPDTHPRSMTLTKFDMHDWRPGEPSSRAIQVPGQHRYPVWWTGDDVTLGASVQSMVDSGVHGMKPYVHSDCGGDHRAESGGSLMRWVAHCSFGTILRIHGADHRPWSYDQHTEDVIASYLRARYKLMPTLIAAGHQAHATAFPLVVRCDLFWPEHKEARSNTQYLFLNDTLVAPIAELATNETERTVWVPPGKWRDAWSGVVTTGPTEVRVRLPYERQPMWYQEGSLIVTTDSRAHRVHEQDWSRLVLNSFVDITQSSEVCKDIYERESSNRTTVCVSTNADTMQVTLRVGHSTASPRAWAWRLRCSSSHVMVNAKDHTGVSLSPSIHRDGFLFQGTPHDATQVVVQPDARMTDSRYVVATFAQRL